MSRTYKMEKHIYTAAYVSIIFLLTADALPAKEMTCDAIPCGTDTCKNIHFRDFLNLRMYWMVVWCSPGDFFCNMYRCDSIL
jgi:hypothetical protein